MNWYKNNKTDIVKEIKEILKKHSFTSKLMTYYNIPVEDIDNHLDIEFLDLGKDFAKGNGRKILLDKRLLNSDFFTDNFHFVIHEFFHWMKRRSEHNFYFNDPEEIQSFVLAITWELINNKSKKEIYKKIYPIIKGHFQSDRESVRVFEEMFQKAVNLMKLYSNNF